MRKPKSLVLWNVVEKERLKPCCVLFFNKTYFKQESNIAFSTNN